MIESTLPKTYSPEGIEDKWYKTWDENKCFKPVANKDKGAFTVIMPPPNVTGKLHMGHALDHTVQDVLIRFKRMQGFETLWVPGQDHAGIATQAKVEEKIFKEEGKTKHDLGRDEFVKRIWDWKEEYGGHIIEQVKKLGDSCDWDYFTFTMDDGPKEAVTKFFIDMYNEGLIYQDNYIINWDPKLQSAISDAEVEHKDIDGNFYHIKYKVKDSKKTLEIATTRPETLFGDTAVAVNPNDDRYEDLIGKKAIIPICNREVTIIADEHVDMEKGTGCLKVTPGHDFNDYEIGKRHNLEIINILNKDGTMNENAKEVQGLKSKEARKQTVKLLKELDILIDMKPHKHPVGHSQRSGDIVEPMVSKQWFLNTQKMAEVSVDEVEKEKMKFYPKGWENTYFSYQKNPRPWCISRQLWWGHQIPVYECSECNEIHVSKDAPNECIKCGSKSLTQDPDVLDTWFSSGLFPLSTLGWPNTDKMKEKGFDKFYPTSTLVTGFDIIFFWVARMMMQCHKVTEKSPFEHVYIHAIVRDKNGIKMSKSLGNVIDPLDIISQYGCDALRFTLAVNSGYNRNINLDPEIIQGNRNFINKLWNAFRFIEPYLQNANDNGFELQDLHHHEKWILAELNNVIKKVTASFEEYRFDDGCNAIYAFVYDKFCSWFIELSKGILNSENDILKSQRANVLKYCFKQIMKLIHPVTPFISEEIWSHLKSENDDYLIRQDYPIFNNDHKFDADLNNMSKFMEVVTSIRNLRSSVQIKPKEEISLMLFTDDEALARYFYKSRGFFKELAKVNAGKIKDKSIDRPAKSIMKATAHTEVFIPLEGIINLEDYSHKLENDLAKLKKEYEKIEKKLNNKNFMENAPENVVVEVKEKASGFEEKIKSIENSLDNFKQ
ncbi:MAG: valine--tRNA ligase [Bacteriovoracaceae bacterium]|jgi:valyl-tRNA synthetase|nr:valine--tRNA ligase [Bacteriovoracaceae bacterium]